MRKGSLLDWTFLQTNCPWIFKVKGRILAQLISRQSGYYRPLLAAFAVVFGLGVLIASSAFGTLADSPGESLPRQEISEQLALPLAETLESVARSFIHEEKFRRGDSVAALMQRAGVDDEAALQFLHTDPAAQILFRQLSPGKNFTLETGPHGELERLLFPLNGGEDRVLTITRQADRFMAAETSLPTETRMMTQAAEIRSSLFAAADAADIPDAVATQLADLFGGDIDFLHDLRKGDRFTVIYESITYLGRPVRSGRILAAEFINAGRSYRAAWFADDRPGSPGGAYYTADGKPLRKAFLRSPLEFSRITSGFTLARFHPVLKTWRAHKGIDFGAPTGTRVRATGDGVVDFAGIQGGYGKVIILRHPGRFSTLYGHLSGFAPGLRKGRHISQGEVIGFVGATGLASGPHLHYEFRIDNVYQNPLTVALPGAPALSEIQMARFRAQAADRLAQLDLVRSFDLARID